MIKVSELTHERALADAWASDDRYLHARYRGKCILSSMCRNIRTLFNFDPPATDDEVHAASLQFVRKISGFAKPSRANQAAFDRAVAEVSAVARRLVDSLQTDAPARDREEFAARARARSEARYGRARVPQQTGMK